MPKKISDIFGTTGGPFLTAAEKRELATNETAFVITGCSKREGKFGLQWVLPVQIEGEERRLAFDANPVRDGQFHDLELALQNGETIEPVKLVLKQTADHKEFFDLQDASDGTVPF